MPATIVTVEQVANNNIVPTGTTTGSWRILGASVMELTVPAAVAVLFWFLMIVMVVVATAEGKDSPITAFFTAFGAVGQVFFAFMVFRLGRQQLALTQRIADRQAKIDTFSLRSALFDEYLALRKSLGTRVINDVAVFKLMNLTNRMDRLFSKEGMAPVHAYADRAMALADAKEEEEDIRDGNATGDYEAARAVRVAISKEVRELQRGVYKSLQDELHIS